MLTRLDVGLAELSWKPFFEPIFGPLEPIVRELIALPDEAAVDLADPRPPLVYHSREGVVRGMRFRIIGTKAHGEWFRVHEAHPL